MASGQQEEKKIQKKTIISRLFPKGTLVLTESGTLLGTPSLSEKDSTYYISYFAMKNKFLFGINYNRDSQAYVLYLKFKKQPLLYRACIDFSITHHSQCNPSLSSIKDRTSMKLFDLFGRGIEIETRFNFCVDKSFIYKDLEWLKSKYEYIDVALSVAELKNLTINISDDQLHIKEHKTSPAPLDQKAKKDETISETNDSRQNAQRICQCMNINNKNFNFFYNTIPFYIDIILYTKHSLMDKEGVEKEDHIHEQTIPFLIDPSQNHFMLIPNRHIAPASHGISCTLNCEFDITNNTMSIKYPSHSFEVVNATIKCAAGHFVLRSHPKYKVKYYSHDSKFYFILGNQFLKEYFSFNICTKEPVTGLLILKTQKALEDKMIFTGEEEYPPVKENKTVDNTPNETKSKPADKTKDQITEKQETSHSSWAFKALSLFISDDKQKSTNENTPVKKDEKSISDEVPATPEQVTELTTSDTTTYTFDNSSTLTKRHVNHPVQNI